MSYSKPVIDNVLNFHQELWLQALESGDYKQSSNGFMFTVDSETKEHSFCPLGVACHILDKRHHPAGRSLSHPHRNNDKRISPSPSMFKLFLSPEGECLIQALNDQEQLSFQEIAEAVRSEPHRFFKNFKASLLLV